VTPIRSEALAAQAAPGTVAAGECLNGCPGDFAWMLDVLSKSACQVTPSCLPA